jgi:hypothetical protein
MGSDLVTSHAMHVDRLENLISFWKVVQTILGDHIDGIDVLRSGGARFRRDIDYEIRACHDGEGSP